MNKSKKNKRQDNNIEIINTVEGMMTFGTIEDGLHIADFACCETVELTPYIATCKVQAMRDGNVYITEKPRRQRNKPLFREDNSALTLGRDGRYYFVFTMPKERVKELPEKLVHQALAIAQKVERMMAGKKGGKR
jgi:hypothetical protein